MGSSFLLSCSRRHARLSGLCARRGGCHGGGDAGVAPAQVDQQARLPSVRDPKLWIVKCRTGKERETAVCLMQKFKTLVRTVLRAFCGGAARACFAPAVR